MPEMKLTARQSPIERIPMQNPAPVSDRVINLIPEERQSIFDPTVDQAREWVTRGDTRSLRAVRGSFSLLGIEGSSVRMTRTLDRPMRFFLAKRVDGPVLVVADRIDRIQDYLATVGLGDQFHPSYTRMVPAHHVMTVHLTGCPDPAPDTKRFFTPQLDSLPQDLEVIGRRYMQAVDRELGEWMDSVPANAPIGIAFSGGIDSGSVLLLAHDILTRKGKNPQRLKAFTLSVDGGGPDVEQAREFLKAVGLELYLEVIDVSSDLIDPEHAIRVIEDYKSLDVEAGAMCFALLSGIRHRYPDWRHILDGDGGDENLKDYPIHENAELTIRSVLSNPLLYQEGWGVGKLKHSSMFSGGQSRSIVRTYGPTTELGFEGFSPYTRMDVIEVAEAIPYVDLTAWSVDALYGLKGEIVSRGVHAITGIRMPVFEKRRFQHGATTRNQFDETFSSTDAPYRRRFDEIYRQRST